jgi:hypothetical protein
MENILDNQIVKQPLYDKPGQPVIGHCEIMPESSLSALAALLNVFPFDNRHQKVVKGKHSNKLRVSRKNQRK